MVREMLGASRPRISFGTTCRGGGKIYVLLSEKGTQDALLTVTARARGGAEVPSRIVELKDGRRVVVLCVLAVTQTVTVEAFDANGTCVAKSTANVGRHLARLRSMGNTIAKNPDVAVLRSCDEPLRSGDMELVSCRAVSDGDGRALLHAVFAYPVATDDVGMDVRAFTADGCAIPDDRVRLLGSCVAPHARIPEVSCRYVSVSVPAERPDPHDTDAPVLWIRSGGYEGLWRLMPKEGPSVPWNRASLMQDVGDDASWQGVRVTTVEGTDCVLVSSMSQPIDKCVVQRLVEVASRKDVGVAAGRCLFADKTVARGELVVDHLNWRIARYGELAADTEPHEVVAACGELLVMRREVWEVVGGVSEGAGERAWFADLCLKVREQGLAVVEVPKAMVFVDATARDMGVASASDLLQDVRADAWLKQRWPEVLAAGESHATQKPSQGVHMRVSKVIRDRDEDIVRVEVDASEGAVAEAAIRGQSPNGSGIATSVTASVSIGTQRGQSPLSTPQGFSVRVPATVRELTVRAEPAQELHVDEAELARLRDAWWHETVAPDQNPAYDKWLRERHRSCEADLALQRELCTALQDPPVFSVVVASEGVEDEESTAAWDVAQSMASVQAQTYPHFELVDDPDAELQGDFELRLEPGDVLEPDALFWLAREALLHPDVDLVYADEDSLLDGLYCLPVLKPDYDVERLRYQDYLGRMVAVRTDVAQTHVVRHVPRVLLHAATPCKLSRHLPQEPVWEGPRPLVSVIIPNKDMADVLDRCVQSVLTLTSWPNLEVIIVENNSEQARTFALYERLQREDSRVRVVTCALEHGFNFSRLCNEGVVQARGSYVLMLNNDTEVLEADWLDRLMETCVRDEVGCVGAKLLYPDDTVQHVGVLVGSHLGPWHANMDVPAADEGYLGINVVPHRVRAVTGACLLARRAVWDRVGGMDEGLPVDYNDVDLCLRIDAAGLAVVIRPDVTLRHYESVSRGGARSAEAMVGFAHAEGVLRSRWGSKIFGEDPYFNPNFRHNTGRYVLDA